MFGASADASTSTRARTGSTRRIGPAPPSRSRGARGRPSVLEPGAGGCGGSGRRRGTVRARAGRNPSRRILPLGAVRSPDENPDCRGVPQGRRRRPRTGAEPAGQLARRPRPVDGSSASRLSPPLARRDGRRASARGPSAEGRGRARLARQLFSVNFLAGRPFCVSWGSYQLGLEKTVPVPSNSRLGSEARVPGAREMVAAGATGRWRRSGILVEPGGVRRDLLPRVDSGRRRECVLG